MTRREAERYRRRIDRARRALEPKMRSLIISALLKQQAQVYELLDRRAFDAIDLLRIDEQPMIDAYIEIYKIVGLKFAKNVMSSVVKETTQQRQLDLFIEAFRKFVIDDLGDQITYITHVTEQLFKKHVKEVVARAPVDGLSIDEIAEQIRDRIGFDNLYRSERIARTETMRASAFSQQEAVRQLEDRAKFRKKWIPVLDSRTRDSHLLMFDHAEIPIDGVYELGLGLTARFPGDPTLPPEESINCRCAEIYIYVSDDTDADA